MTEGSCDFLSVCIKMKIEQPLIVLFYIKKDICQGKFRFPVQYAVCGILV